MYPVFQWRISPTLATHNNLPECYTPLASQVVTPHVAWITYIGWPKLRDIVIANQEKYDMDELSIFIQRVVMRTGYIDPRICFILWRVMWEYLRSLRNIYDDWRIGVWMNLFRNDT